MPVLLEADPYPLSAELGLRAAPTLMLVGDRRPHRQGRGGVLADDLEAFAEGLGIEGGLFSPDDTAPPRRPG